MKEEGTAQLSSNCHAVKTAAAAAAAAVEKKQKKVEKEIHNRTPSDGKWFTLSLFNTNPSFTHHSAFGVSGSTQQRGFLPVQ